jgi:hypothetical protein
MNFEKEVASLLPRNEESWVSCWLEPMNILIIIFEFKRRKST